MERILVLATANLSRDLLADAVHDEDELIVLVPAVEQSRLQWLANDEDRARADAEAVGRAIAETAPATEATVQVSPDVPSQAIADAIAEHCPDRVLVVLRAGENASWLEAGELARVPSEIDGVPVVRVSLDTAE